MSCGISVLQKIPTRKPTGEAHRTLSHEQDRSRNRMLKQMKKNKFSAAESWSTTGMDRIKEGTREDTSNQHPTVVVKTEPYDAAISAGQEHMGHSIDSASEDAAGSSGVLHIEDDPHDHCDTMSSDCESSSVHSNINARTVQPPLDNTVPVSVTGQATDSKHGDVALGQSETEDACETSTSNCEEDSFYKYNVSLAKWIDSGLLEVQLTTHETKTFSCDTCSATFCHMSTLRAHLKRHTGEGLHKCTLCALVCTSYAGLKRHMLVHACNESERGPTASEDQVGGVRLKSEQCATILSQSESAKDPVPHQIGEKPYKCDLCPAGFSHSPSLRRHKLTHICEKPYKCDLCPAEYKDSTNLRRHKQTHVGEKPYKCNLCPAEFFRRTNLQAHKRTHTGEKPYKCSLCSATFLRHDHLMLHTRTHTGEKPYKCDVCPAEFSQSTNLRSHKQTHNGEKPHKCDFCPAEFSHSTNLRRHMQTHTGEKPYKCNACPAEFRQNAHLQRHKHTHTGEKPYKCNLCLAEFRQSAHLRSHKVKHAGEKSYKCS
ncbi:zinc finger protein ZFP2-like isoform X1 [Ornithodoros turicata]|uniref:zinc finger protein ZFP2-like isoform X1 n=3 Tax=Ornithodoros turicata TaxID=34597 RepID=UPI003139F9FA